MNGSGTIRLSSTTIAEVVARAASETEGVRSDFDHLLRGIELFRGETALSQGEKVPLDAEDLVIRLRVTVSPFSPSFLAVAQRVQRNVFEALELRLGLTPQRIDVEVESVDWSELGERG
ncbi:MAG: Asp23/Gls24 family envelope stress response protein [Atribacterota bacterium]